MATSILEQDTACKFRVEVNPLKMKVNFIRNIVKPNTTWYHNLSQSIVKILHTINGVWIGNGIYWTLKTRNYK
jgi:hypothetical protein